MAFPAIFTNPRGGLHVEPQNRQQTKDLRPEKTIFWPAVISILVISLPMLLFPKASEEIIGAIYQPFAAKFGALYLWVTVALIGLCIYFACSRYGDIKFGEPGEKPRYSLRSWVAVPAWPARSCSGPLTNLCGISSPRPSMPLP